MPLPYFFTENISEAQVQLNEETSKHMIGVLRMQAGQELFLTNGKGQKAKAVIRDENRKRTTVEIISTEQDPPAFPHVSIAISIIKNASRFEWFLEKAAEIGVNEIIPLICDRTEKEKFRFDRMQGILISAMLQSQQTWLPVLHHPTAFAKSVNMPAADLKLLAHCLPEKKQQLSALVRNQSSFILIGPEGDFSPAEIETALSHSFTAVSLGETRLRTETAGIVAATLLKNY